MKITYITHQIHQRGGMERASAEVVARLAQAHDTTVIAARCELSAPRLQWLPVRGPARPEWLHVWDFRRRAQQLAATQDGQLTVSVNTSAAQADVVVAQFCHAAFTTRFGGIRGGAQRWRRAYQRLAQRGFCAQEATTYRNPTLRHIIAVSEGVKRELMGHYRLPAECFTVIPNGVNHHKFKPAANAAEKLALRQRLNLPADKLLGLFLGGDWDRKGLGDAIHAVAQTPDTALAVVGSGDVARFSALATTAKAQDRVFFCGPSLHPQDYCAAADVFVFPSRYEAFSLATLEAAAAGLPILAPRINGTEELIDDGVNGFFVEFNAESIAEKLSALRDDGARLRQMSAAIHQTSLRYDWDRIAAEHLATLEALAASSTPATQYGYRVRYA
jgi:glycosyltransferase involved in cell wall biosynthesis